MQIRALVVAGITALVASCGQAAPPSSTAPGAPHASFVSTHPGAAPLQPLKVEESTIWFVCDNAANPEILIGTYPDQNSHIQMTVYSKTSNNAYTEDLAVSNETQPGTTLFRPLQRAGADVGGITQFSAGAGFAHGEEYTDAVSDVRLDGQDHVCRWLPRTRFSGFSSHRFYSVSEEGPRNDNLERNALVLRIFNFDAAQNIGTSEIHGGRDFSNPPADRFVFQDRDVRYEVRVPDKGPAIVEAHRNGAQLWSETILALTIGPQDNTGD